MMTRLHRIEIKNFKAFREFQLAPEGRHLLIYGGNGAGKSSLYWALYTFLQSARKPTLGDAGIAKYFDPAVPQNLLNTHEQAETTPKLSEIALTLRDVATKTDTTHRIGRDPNGQTIHGTLQHPAILKGDLASDFITYRFFFGFSHFRNSEKFNLWPLFEKEILPFVASATTLPQSPLDWWHRIKSGVANPTRSRGLGGAYAYDEFERHTKDFADVLSASVDLISAKAQEFYDQHFSKDDSEKVTLRLSVPKKQGTGTPAFPRFDRDLGLEPPFIEFGIQVGNKPIGRPQSHLNEAKMTQLGLSVRFAASLVNLHDPNNEFLKLLVLDDLLVSLDMSNRMKVVEILLSDTFANYQKIILTHELGFFREFRRTIGAGHPDWCFIRLEGSPLTAISCQEEKTELQKAEEYLHGHSLDEAATCLRKATEATVQRYLKPSVVPTKDFVTLTDQLRAARKKLLAKLPTQLYDKILHDTPTALREHLIPGSDTDVDALTGLASADHEAIKHQRRQLRKLLKDEHWKAIENAKLIDEVLKTTERVLNPGAHGGEAPLYELEVKKALDLIKALEKCLS